MSDETRENVGNGPREGGEAARPPARVPLVAPRASPLTFLRMTVHLLGEGVKGLAISPGQALACIVSLAVAAALVTLFASFGSLAVGVLERSGQRARIVVYIKDEVPSAALEDLIGRVRSNAEVDKVEYLSREQDRARNSALLPRDLVATLPADAVPGQQCLEVTFREATGHAPDIAKMAEFVRSLEGVDVVAEPPIGAARIRSMAAAVEFGRVMLTIVAVLLLASTVFFVVGTLTRTMERRREEMAILRLVGATDMFVKTPLYVQGILQGVLGVGAGALAGLAVVRGTNAYLAGELALGLAIPSYPATTMTLAVLVGASVGAFGALIASVRRLP